MPPNQNTLCGRFLKPKRRRRISGTLIWTVVFGALAVITGCAAGSSTADVRQLRDAADPRLTVARLASSAMQLRGTLTPGLSKTGATAVSQLVMFPRDGCHVLALSGGGPDGAYGAGVLAGWSASGMRPQFAAVTGVSIGALIAPFAFLGPAHDDALRRALTGEHIDRLIGQIDPLGLILGEAAYSNARIADLIEKFVTDRLLVEIAQQHGRRLLVATTNLDTEQLAIWDMGQIAASGRADATQLFRRILLAAVSVPGALPPIPIETLNPDGRLIRSLHADAGAMLQIYIDPEMIQRRIDPHYSTQTCYYHAIVNNHLAPKRVTIAPRATVVALRAFSSVIKTHTLQTLDRAADAIRRRGGMLRVAYLNPNWPAVGGLDFERAYMASLYRRAVVLGRDGSAWTQDLPR